MKEKIKIKATLECGTPCVVRHDDIVEGLALFIQTCIEHDQVTRLKSLVQNPSVEPTKSIESNAVLADRIAELDRRLTQSMSAAHSQVESINGLIEEVSRLREENSHLKGRVTEANIQRNLLQAKHSDAMDVIANLSNKQTNASVLGERGQEGY